MCLLFLVRQISIHVKYSAIKAYFDGLQTWNLPIRQSGNRITIVE